MRTYIVLCLVAVTCADNLGYGYQPAAHSDSGLSQAPETAVELSRDVPSAPSYDTSAQSAPAELDKEFYTFQADDAEFDDANAAQRIANTVKQALRVVFVKGPENKGFEDAALALAKQAAQQQTAIYVLNKQADIGALADKLNAAGKNANNKPEVHFVKYRTAEDAANAQRTIQSQYDSLAGNSQNINAGVAPVLNFASQSQIPGVSAQIPKNAYLPTSVFRFRS